MTHAQRLLNILEADLSDYDKGLLKALGISAPDDWDETAPPPQTLVVDFTSQHYLDYQSAPLIRHIMACSVRGEEYPFALYREGSMDYRPFRARYAIPLNSRMTDKTIRELIDILNMEQAEGVLRYQVVRGESRE